LFAIRIGASTMKRRHVLAASFFLLSTGALFAAGCCCEGVKAQETIYEGSMVGIDELIDKLEGQPKKDLEAEKASLEAEYQKLPKDEEPRAEALSALNEKIRKVVDKYEKKVEEQEAAGEAKRLAAEAVLMKPYLGTWKGGGVSLSISSDRSVQYEKKTSGSSKSVNAPVTRFTKDEFDVGAFGMTTTFKIDKPPHEDAGTWKMTIDGVELTREAP
jgi:hypothetical protein